MTQDFSAFEGADASRLGFCGKRFSTWSPFAKKVSLLFYRDFDGVLKNEISAEFAMEACASGVWSFDAASRPGLLGKNKYYKYRFTFEDAEYEVCDIWGRCFCADSLATELSDITYKKEYFNPFGSSGAVRKSFSDASIFELHIRDWSRAFFKDSTGKFTHIASSKKLMEHLKELGITHVQLLPAFEYANPKSDKSYNWGYDPYNYNAPESRYVSDGVYDGKSAVKELRRMIEAFHKNGIAVNLDVVYNHTSGTGKNSLYDMTVPGYFYRMRQVDGGSEYYNGSGCGNEIASNHRIVREFIIASLRHWMQDFHINGFRFDLMGVLEASAMKEIYEELKKIDPNVLVYGEPWCGGECGVEGGCTKEAIDSCGGVACFNDSFRDAIKGAEFMGFRKGQVQGIFNDRAIATGLTGSLKKNGGFTESCNRSINYVECHDNFTLFDKLAISYLDRTEFRGDLYGEIGLAGLETVKKQDILSAALVILAQGVPFINGGQEFMRTKGGDENSYISGDEVNQIDFSFKEKNADVFNAYKGLFALRHSNPAAFGANEGASAQILSEGVLLYRTGDFAVIFNATKSAFRSSLNGYDTLIDLLSGELLERPLQCGQDGCVNAEVNPLSFVVLKKS